jgi:UDP-N-acetylmuramoylalanine--D-glutamate ligase
MAKVAQRNYKVGGNLGVPALELLDDSDTELFILELSSFQLETTLSLNAVAAIVLNVAPDHMDRYESFASYAATKQRIYSGDGVMVINKDDATVMAMRDETRKTIYFGMSHPADSEFGLIEKDGQTWLAKGDKCFMPASDIRLPGRHNLANVLAAMALADAIGLPQIAIIEAARSFTGLAHRCQWVANIDGINFYNDSKATNVGASVAALQGMPGKTILIAGGQGKGTDYSALRDVIAQHAAAVVLIGEEADTLATVIHNVVPVLKADSMQMAVAESYKLARQHHANVLLAPACASFDMFSNFEHRGDCFIEAVRGLQS